MKYPILFPGLVSVTRLNHVTILGSRALGHLHGQHGGFLEVIRFFDVLGKKLHEGRRLCDFSSEISIANV